MVLMTLSLFSHQDRSPDQFGAVPLRLVPPELSHRKLTNGSHRAERVEPQQQGKCFVCFCPWFYYFLGSS